MGKKVQWTHPSLGDESNEFERTSEELDIDMNTLIDAYTKADLEGLGDDIWSKLQNSDSYKIKSEEEAKRIAKSYGKDISSIFKALDRGSSIASPIILILPDGSPYLMAGNTRLMAARVRKISPKVLVLRLEENLAKIAARIAKISSQQLFG
jgi:hypothetical protein